MSQLERAESTIPLGSQTFSKSRTAYPLGAAPLFASRGRGGRIWDVDGNEYVDLVCGLASVLLGYRDPDVDAAVKAQLDDGVTFSLAHPLEAEVAELLVEMIPCAERVRFGKNGSDATTGAIRLARAHTGREHVLMCGYHGWQDWSIGTTSRDGGVPVASKALTTTFAYGDLNALEDALKARPVAAVILEPMTSTMPPDGFLEGARSLTQAHGALLIFDEMLTGFRFHNGGAQALFGVTPDLATFGKGLGNGLPISAVCGRADVMAGMEEIFFSSTFGGETLALAAARAVLTKLQSEPVLARIAQTGEALRDGLAERLRQNGAEHLMQPSGHPAWLFVNLTAPAGVDAWELRTLFLQEMSSRGVLTLGTHNICAAHDDRDVEHVLNAYDELLPIMVDAVERGTTRSLLRGTPLEPLFRVR